MINKKDLWFIIILLGLVSLFFWQVIFSDFTFIDRVYTRYFYPIRVFSAQCIREGILPLWNPYQFCGFPFLANPQSGIFYPLSIITYLIPFELGIKLFIVFQTFLGGLFMYLLMRNFGLRPISCLVSSIAFIFNGYILSVDLLTGISSIIFTPVIFFFFHRSLVTKNHWYGILTGIMIGLQFLGGEPAVFYASCLTLFLFAITKRIISFKLFLFISIGVSLFLFQLLPFIELILNSTKIEKISIQECLSIYEILGFIFPISPGIFKEPLLFWIGQDWLKSNYLGVVLFSLCLIGMASKRGVFWGVIFGISILLSLGLIHNYLPGLAQIRFPVRFFCLTIFSFSILVGFGFERILGKDKKIIGILIIFGLIYLIFLIIGFLAQERIIITLYQRYFMDSDISNIRKEYLEIVKNFILPFMFLVLAILLILFYKNGMINFPMFSISLIFIITIESFIFTFNLNPVIKEDFYKYESPIIRFLKVNDGIYRITRTPDLDIEAEKYYYLFQGRLLPHRIRQFQDYLIPNFGLISHIFDVYGYNVLQIKDYMDFWRVFNQKLLSTCPHILDLLNIRYVIAKENVDLKQLKLVYQKSGILVYENLSVLPRAFLVNKASYIKDRKKILDVLGSPNFNPAKEVILEEEIPNIGSGIQDIGSKIKIIDYQPNRVVLEVYAVSDCILFLSDTYYPGWRAFIDNKQTKIYRANFAFRAIYLPKGMHQVRFEYWQLSFLIGSILSIISGIVVLYLVIQTIIQKYKALNISKSF